MVEQVYFFRFNEVELYELRNCGSKNPLFRGMTSNYSMPLTNREIRELIIDLSNRANELFLVGITDARAEATASLLIAFRKVIHG